MKLPGSSASRVARNWPREWWHCKRKIKYTSKSAAGKAARATKGCHVYSCDYCDGWHVGHPRKAR